MHITRIHIRGFKRFHDLTIEVAGTPRLVVLCGPNGVGKSSLIDALRIWHGTHGSAHGWTQDEPYYRKVGDAPTDWGSMVEVTFSEDTPADPRKLIYARSAYRHEPDFRIDALRRQGDLFTAPTSMRMIDSEVKVSDNYQRLVSATLDDVYGGAFDDLSIAELRDRRIGHIRSVLVRLFPDLNLQGPGDPVGGGTFLFEKGTSRGFEYKNLSGGEKAAFDLVLDLAIKSASYDDTVFVIDEPELHMNPRLQGTLLEELMSIVGERGQLWVATHSVGMMRKAQQLWSSDPESVAFLDFDGHDFDTPVSVTPVRPNRQFWSSLLAVALGDVAGLVAPDHVVLCEGRPATHANPARAEFDARCYRAIFAAEFPNADFVSVGNSADVANDRLEVGRTIQAIVSGTRVTRLIDRDLRTPQEVEDLARGGTRVLSRRQIESYLLDDEALALLGTAGDRPVEPSRIIALRNDAIQASVERGHDSDDWKLAAPGFYASVRRELALQRPGGTVEAFLADVVAPLIRPGMAVYAELREDIFGDT